MLGIGGVFFDGVPDAVDVDGDGGCIAEGFHAPDAVVDGFPAENDIRVNHKEFKQLEFLIEKRKPLVRPGVQLSFSVESLI